MLRLAAAALLILTSTASAQNDAEDADAKAVAAYRLTMPALRKYEAVADDVIAFVKTLPASKAEEGAKADREDMSIDEMASEVMKVKPVADALQKAGMSAREYVLFTMAMVHAGLCVTLKKQGGACEAGQAPPANIKFVEDNAALLAAVKTKVETANKGMARYRKG